MTQNKFRYCAMIFSFLFFLLLWGAPATGGECKDHIELHSAAHLAKEYGKSEMWILQNVKIALWKKQTKDGKFPKVGELLPGSRAVIIANSAEDYKVKSPLDGSIGWVNKIQVSRIVRQNTITREPCE